MMDNETELGKELMDALGESEPPPDLLDPDQDN